MPRTLTRPSSSSRSSSGTGSVPAAASSASICLGQLDRPAVAEHREPAQGELLVRLEQPVAGGDRVAQGDRHRLAGPATRAGQVEHPVAVPVEDLVRSSTRPRAAASSIASGRPPSRRTSVDQRADLVRLERRAAHPAQPVQEQRRGRVRARPSASVGSASAGGTTSGATGQTRSPGSADRVPAGGQDPQRGRRVRQPGQRLGHGVRRPLDRVDQQQRRARRRAARRRSSGRPTPKTGGDAAEQSPAVDAVGDHDPGHAARVRGGDPVRDGQRQARSCPRRPGRPG